MQRSASSSCVSCALLNYSLYTCSTDLSFKPRLVRQKNETVFNYCGRLKRHHKYDDNMAVILRNVSLVPSNRYIRCGLPARCIQVFSTVTCCLMSHFLGYAFCIIELSCVLQNIPDTSFVLPWQLEVDPI